MRFGHRKAGKFNAKPEYYCKGCSMQWASVPPEKVVNRKGKLAVTAEMRLKARTCPSCGSTDTIFFASKREAHRYRELLLAQQAGLISDIELQPRFKFPCDVEYRADFAYTDTQTGKRIFEDSKGHETTEFKIKMKLLKYFRPEAEVVLV